MTTTENLLLLILVATAVNLGLVLFVTVAVISQARTRRKVLQLLEKKSRDQRTTQH